ncbi:uncharacterized protein LOC129585157 isoform X2 [Paramacrobiotus metropolitanus]|nr:uncharacterized protein LOC129585157 isoform X2 [Paramacrobiotus metropolitanus]
MAGLSFESIGRYLGQIGAQTAVDNGLDRNSFPELLRLYTNVIVETARSTLKWIGLSFLFRYLSVEFLLTFVTIPTAAAEGQGYLSNMQRTILMTTDIAVVIAVICAWLAVGQINSQQHREALFNHINHFWT